jgi:hypothetical protein
LIDLKLDLRDFTRAADRLAARIDQVPFALARAMNDAARETRKRLISETWPQHVTQRNSYFIRASLRTEWASKYNLTVSIYDALGRGHLELHADGGTRTARGGRLAIPQDIIRRTSRGVSKSQTPRAIIARTPKRALRITPTGIFVGEHGRLRMAYKLQPSIQMKADVPFKQDFVRFMREEIDKAFPVRLAEAMRTAK